MIASMARLAAVIVALAVMTGGAIFLASHYSAPNACGAPRLTATFSSKHIFLDGCDGELTPPSAGITLAMGESVTVGKTAQWSGFSSSDLTILARKPASGYGTVFTAVGNGMASIQVKATGSCASTASTTTCEVLGVTVSS